MLPGRWEEKLTEGKLEKTPTRGGLGPSLVGTQGRDMVVTVEGLGDGRLGEGKGDVRVVFQAAGCLRPRLGKKGARRRTPPRK